MFSVFGDINSGGVGGVTVATSLLVIPIIGHCYLNLEIK